MSCQQFLFLQTEYFCDTTTPPAAADNVGDYIVIPQGVNANAPGEDGCIASTVPATPPPAVLNVDVPSITKLVEFSPTAGFYRKHRLIINILLDSAVTDCPAYTTALSPQRW